MSAAERKAKSRKTLGRVQLNVELDAPAVTALEEIERLKPRMTRSQIVAYAIRKYWSEIR